MEGSRARDGDACWEPGKAVPVSMFPALLCPQQAHLQEASYPLVPLSPISQVAPLPPAVRGCLCRILRTQGAELERPLE